MRNSLKRRLEGMERQLGVGADALPHLFLYFSDQKIPDPYLAQCGEQEWHRGPSESKEEFSNRVAADLVPWPPKMVFFY
jgi:hypothetical protein